MEIGQWLSHEKVMEIYCYTRVGTLYNHALLHFQLKLRICILTFVNLMVCFLTNMRSAFGSCLPKQNCEVVKIFTKSRVCHFTNKYVRSLI